MQTILGSGGAIGVELARCLPEFTDEIRLVSRNPQRVNETDKVFSADILDGQSVMKAVEGSEVVYLTVGFPYSKKVWKKAWPVAMRNVIEACKTHGSKLVFFDNIYMYDQNHLDGMDENTPVNPPSEKGKVREIIARMLMDEMTQGNLEGLIARSADFYGPGIRETGILNETVFKNVAAGKKGNWLGSARFKHSFTYTPDAAAATALLGNSPDAFGRVWHLPTASNPPTGEEWIEMIAKALNRPPKMQVARKTMVKFLGLFMPIMRELSEMIYQYDRHYVFNSKAFEERFGFEPTPYEEGIRAIVEADFNS
jgi:nucleoside-diphosphate-sugar epimerase